MVAILRTLVGTPPAGYEVLEYLVAALLALMFVLEVLTLFRVVGHALRR